MLSVNEAKKKILEHTCILTSETIDFRDSLNRVLAQDIKATSDWPPFTRSTMDGFAVRSRDVKRATASGSVLLKIAGESKAGEPFVRRIGKMQSVIINTGACLPQGFDSVVKSEDAVQRNDCLVISSLVKPGQHCRRQGQDARQGDLIIAKGCLITPGTMALMASLGISRVRVYKIPTIGIITTGHELVNVSSRPRSGQIRSSNEYALCAQASGLHAKPCILGRSKDDLKSIIKIISKGLMFDILLVSGGVSVGRHDLVREALQQLGVKEIFWKVAVKPGKPLVFAKKRRCHVFGLPGNTVSSMVSFLTFVRPCAFKMSGLTDVIRKETSALLDQSIHDPDPRVKIVRGVVFKRAGKLYVRLSEDQISENILSMAKANCLITIPADTVHLEKGSLVNIEYL